MKKPRMYATVAGLAVLVLAFLYLPLPYHIISTLEIKARDAKTAFVSVPGRLEEVRVKPGQRVSQGDVLAELSNVDLDLEIAQLEGRRNLVRVQRKNLTESYVHNDPSANTQVPELDKALDAIEQQLKEKQRDRERLKLKAPRDGVVLPPPWIPARDDPRGRLPTWSRTPLDPRNLKCYLEPGTSFCLVGDPEQMEAMLVVDQADIDFVAEEQKVEIKLDQLPHDVFPGSIAKIAQKEMEASPKRLSAKAGGELPTETDPESGVERPMSASYQASVPLPAPEGLLRIGLCGRAKVHVRPQTLAQRVWRLLTRTFNFEL